MGADLHGKVAVVTGAAQGIGRAIAVRFLVSNAGSYVNGHNPIVDGGWTCGFSRDF